ncbi:hypothetical protein [Winogradskyella sp. PC D3.3]
MAFKNIFENPEFEKKFQRVRKSIEQYLSEKEYDLGELTIDELIWWRDIRKTRIIETTEKCPSDLKNIVTDIIKREFPNTNV